MARNKDIDIRIPLVRRLLSEGVERRDIRHELTLDTASSGGRADLILLLEKLIGIEIKSSSDTLDRLAEQIYATRMACDGVWTVIDVRHREGLRGQPWAHHVIYNSGEFSHRYDWPMPRLLPALESHSHGDWGASDDTSTVAMARLLWRSEAIAVGWAMFQIKFKTRVAAINHIREHGCLKDLRPLVVEELRKRTHSLWEQQFWKRFDAAEAA